MCGLEFQCFEHSQWYNLMEIPITCVSDGGIDLIYGPGPLG